MTQQLRIGLLCNSVLALPALQKMVGENVLCAIATAGRDREAVNMIQQLALQNQIDFSIFPEKKNIALLTAWLEKHSPDVVFVMTFGWRIPAALLAIPRFGFINFHYGLLPEMRGADPIFESIRRQRSTAGITVHVMDEGFDTGPVMVREEVAISPEHTYGMLSGQLARMGERICLQIISNLRSGSIPPAVQQDEANASYLHRVGAGDLNVDWQTMDSAAIQALVKACNPVTKGVPITFNGWQFCICDVSLVNLQGDASAIKPGTILAIDQQNGLLVCCNDGKALRLEVVYTAEGFFQGYKLAYWGVTQGQVLG